MGSISIGKIALAASVIGCVGLPWVLFGVGAACLSFCAVLAGFLVARLSREKIPQSVVSRPLEPDPLQRELEEISERYRLLFDIVPCYITLQDHDLRIVDSNTLFRQDFGDRAGEKCYCAYKGKDDICTDCPVLKTFADGEIHSSEETVVTRDGRKAAVMVYSMPVHDENGKTRAVMEVSTNITEVKELQRQLILVGLAVAGMAHRIKNVIMGLEGGIFVVNTGFADNDDATVQRGWGMVQRNTAKISRVARDLLFCSKERAPQLVAGTSPIAIAREVYELFAPRLLAEGIEMRLEVADEDDCGSFDPEAVHSLIANLVANALDACRFDSSAKKHVVVLRCRRDNDVSVVEVEDNGPGISKEDSKHVFDGFFSTKGTEGTGLGLLVVQKVAEQHGGGVTFESEPGMGTTFRAVLVSQNRESTAPGPHPPPQ